VIASLMKALSDFLVRALLAPGVAPMPAAGMFDSFDFRFDSFQSFNQTLIRASATAKTAYNYSHLTDISRAANVGQGGALIWVHEIARQNRALVP
jgi:hypothetical protein